MVAMGGSTNKASGLGQAVDKIFVTGAAVGTSLPGAASPGLAEVEVGDSRVPPGWKFGVIGEGGGGWQGIFLVGVGVGLHRSE